jgi:hypothetical protein
LRIRPLQSNDLRFDEFQMVQQFLEQEPMVRRDATVERRLERGNLPAQQPPREVSELRRVVLARDERLEHRAPRRAERIGGDRRELHIRIFQHLLDPIRDAIALLTEGDPIAREIPQLGDRRGRDETALQQSVLQ